MIDNEHGDNLLTSALHVNTRQYSIIANSIGITFTRYAT
jgi:hypothetical protein